MPTYAYLPGYFMLGIPTFRQKKGAKFRQNPKGQKKSSKMEHMPKLVGCSWSVLQIFYRVFWRLDTMETAYVLKYLDATMENP